MKKNSIVVTRTTSINESQVIKILRQVFSEEFVSGVQVTWSPIEAGKIFNHIQSNVFGNPKLAEKLESILLDRIVSGSISLEVEDEIDVSPYLKDDEYDDECDCSYCAGDDEDDEDDDENTGAHCEHKVNFLSSLNSIQENNDKILESISEDERKEVINIARKSMKKANKKINKYIDSLKDSPDEEFDGYTC